MMDARPSWARPFTPVRTGPGPTKWALALPGPRSQEQQEQQEPDARHRESPSSRNPGPPRPGRGHRRRASTRPNLCGRPRPGRRRSGRPRVHLARDTGSPWGRTPCWATGRPPAQTGDHDPGHAARLAGAPPRAVPRPWAGWPSTARRLRDTPGVRFAKLLGTGTGTGFGPADADLTRWAALVVWDDAEPRRGFDETARPGERIAPRAAGSTCARSPAGDAGPARSRSTPAGRPDRPGRCWR